jgi:hypothetical protein
MDDREIIERLANGEDPWAIDPEYGCTNPLTGYYPAAEVKALQVARATLDAREEAR